MSNNIGKWLEDKSGRIFEVNAESKTDYFGREIIETELKLKYGKEIAVSKSDIIETDMEN